MEQASSQFQQFIHWLQGSSLPLLHSKQVKWLTRYLDAWKGWLSGLAIVAVLLMWHWQLVVSAGAGLLVMTLVYLVQQGQWRLPGVDWQTWWSRANRPLTLSIVSGGVALLSVYLTIAIWSESKQSWLATGMILQGFGSLAALILLTWQTIDRYWGDRQDGLGDRVLNQRLADLADADSLKRLIAVRQLTQWATTVMPVATQSTPITPAHLAECFRLMLNRETEPAVCSALLEGLQTLNGNPQLHASEAEAIAVPVATRQARARVRRHFLADEDLNK